MFFIGYRCSICQTEYNPTQLMYTCDKDGGNLDVVLDYPAINRSISPNKLLVSNDPSLWRFGALLPVGDPGDRMTPLRVVGGTPIYSPIKLSAKLGTKQLWIKDESRNPTASLKDRASAIVLVRAGEIDARVVVTASTGNAGAALAGMAAARNQQAVIFAPRSAPPAKVAQLLVFGAQVFLVEGTYDSAFDLTIQAAKEFGWYCRNTGYNPFTAEGKKTAALEIWAWWQTFHSKRSQEQLSIFVSVGDGNIISGLHKGFKDLAALGWLEQFGMPMPRIFGVQATGSAAITNAFLSGRDVITAVVASTIADSISVDLPRDGIRAIHAVRETGGSYIKVSDADILKAISALGQDGIFAEPAGAASFAGLVKAIQSQLIEPGKPVLVINTGSGLKDIRAAMQSVPAAPIIEPTLEAIKRVIKYP